MPSRKDPLEVMGVEEFLATDYHQEELLAGLLSVGDFMLIAGATEAGKSYLAKQLAYEIATGGNFLGKWNVARPFKTLFIQGEIGRQAFQKRLAKFSRYYGEAPNLQVATHYSYRLDEPGNLAPLAKVLERTETQVLILDPMRPFHLGDENSSQDMERFFGAVRELKDDLTIIQTQHERKPHPGEKSNLAGIRGSALITDRPDVVLHLSRSKGKWELVYEKMRNADSVEKPDNEELKVGKSGLFVPHDIKAEAVTDAQVLKDVGKGERFRAEVVELLMHNCNVSNSTAGRAIDRLVGSGRLEMWKAEEDGRQKKVRTL